MRYEEGTSRITNFDSELEADVIHPGDGAEDVRIEGMNTTLEVNITHLEGKQMNVTFYNATDDVEIGNVTYVEDGLHNVTWENLEYGTEYMWYVNVTEANNEEENWTESNDWTFTTEHIPNKVREPIRPDNGATEVIADPLLEVNVSHPEGEDMWVIFFGGEKDENKNYLGERLVSDGGTASLLWRDLNYDTTYEWNVTVEEDTEDPDIIKSETWNFTTKNFEAPAAPEYPEDSKVGLSIGSINETELRVEVEHPENKSMNVTFWNSTGGHASKIGVDTGVSSGEEASVVWENLNYGTTYKWYVEIKDEVGRTRESDEWEFETEHIPNKVRNPIHPAHTEQKLNIGPERETELRVEVNHPENKDMNVTFWNSTGDHASKIGVDTGVSSGEEASVIWEDLKSSTTYEWYVEVEDEDYNTTSEKWKFTTIRFTELTLNIEGEGTVEVDWDEEKHEVEAVETLEIEAGTDVLLTIDPSEGWYFAGWSGDIVCTEPTIEITMDEDREITATFEIKTYGLTVNIDGEGKVEVEGEEWGDGDSKVYEEGTDVTLEANPDEGWVFREWTGDLKSDEKEMTITMDEDMEITATFEIKTYNLTVNIDGEGKVEVEGEEWGDGDSKLYEEGTDVTLEATPDEGWVFREWTGDYEGDIREITLTIDEDKELHADFAELFNLTINIEVEGRFNGDDVGRVEVEIDGEVVAEVEDEWSGEFMEGTEVKLTASTEYGKFTEWTGDYEGEKKEITIRMDEDKEITANFFLSVKSNIQKTIPGFNSSLLILAVFFAVIIYHKKIRNR
ncbi:MAG: hypothetical protein KGY66_06470 [Candidatus Thermoplasmatota archaeon]|nr:hypothetical protein [Candidatus Thermoplasmatota archaeon]MBS3790542.1 hypothetical protein [Candidatus Thermoplasmatota archaeon]